MDILHEWAGLAAFLISIGTTVYAWLTAGSRTNAEALMKVDERVDEHERRLMAIEAEWKHLPDKESVHRLELSLSDMKGDLSSISKQSEATHRAMMRMEDYLMKSGGGGG